MSRVDSSVGAIPSETDVVLVPWLTAESNNRRMDENMTNCEVGVRWLESKKGLGAKKGGFWVRFRK